MKSRQHDTRVNLRQQYLHICQRDMALSQHLTKVVSCQLFAHMHALTFAEGVSVYFPDSYSHCYHHHIASLVHCIAPPWPVSKGWQGQIQCHFGVGLSKEHEDEDDQVDVSCPDQVNDQILGRLDNVGCCMLESPE